MNEEYDCMRELYVGTKSTTEGSPKEQAVTDLRKQGLSYMETAILTNPYCLHEGHGTTIRSVVHPYKQNMA